MANGVHAHPTVNVDSAENIGIDIISKMEGISADNFSFKRKDQAITLACKSSVKVDGELVQVDP